MLPGLAILCRQPIKSLPVRPAPLAWEANFPYSYTRQNSCLARVLLLVKTIMNETLIKGGFPTSSGREIDSPWVLHDIIDKPMQILLERRILAQTDDTQRIRKNASG